jgi:PAS domain S-box-containing protein
MLDEVPIDLFIAIYSLITVTTFAIITMKRRQLYSWLPALVSYVIGSWFIFLKFLNPIVRVIGNLFYMVSIILFVTIISIDYYKTKTDGFTQRKALRLFLTIFMPFFVVIMIPINVILIRIQIYILFLLFNAIVLFFRVFLLKKTPTHVFMLLTSVSAFFSGFTTLCSVFNSSFFWEFSYMGNVIFVTCILATSFVALLEDRLKNSEKGLLRAYDTMEKQSDDLRKSELRYKTLYQTARVGLISTDIEGIVLTANKAAVKLLGYKTANRVIGNNISTYFKDSREHESLEALRENLLRRGLVDNFELPFKRKDGSIIVLEIGSNLIKDGNTSNIRIETVLRDITEYKKAEEIRKTLEEKREEFISLTQHELRTPLTIGLGWCDYLLMKGMSNENDEKILQNIKTSLTRLERLVENTRTTEQLEQNFFQFDEKQIDFCSFITEIFEYYQRCLGEAFQFKGCPEDIITIKGDKAKLQQIIDNIMDNAIKHTPKENRQIKAEIKTQDDTVIISIHDNGAGIRTIDLERIFDKYVSIPTNNSVVGTGLGLYLVREVLRSHDGSIIAESKGRGKGSIFTITLPCNIQHKACSSSENIKTHSVIPQPKSKNGT